MTIRMKTLAIVAVVVVSLITVLTTLSYFLETSRFARLETRVTEILVQRVRNRIDVILTEINTLAGDWAPRDDTCRFVQQPDKSYIHTHLADSTLANLRINFMIFFGRDGDLVYSRYHDLDPDRPAVFAAEILKAISGEAALLKHGNDPRHRVSGILSTPSSPYLVASHAIVSSNFEGPVQGTLVIGRALDNAEIERARIVSLTNWTIKHLTPPIAFDLSKEMNEALKNPGHIFTETVSPEAITGYITLSDISGNPTLLLSATHNRDILQYGLATWRINALLLAGFSLAFIVLLMVLLDRTVLKRLGGLTQQVKKIDMTSDWQARLDDACVDEIGQLVDSINGMLNTVARYRMEQDENERYLRQLLDAISCGIAVVDAETHIVVDINKAAMKLFQRPREDVVGRKCHRLVCPKTEGDCPITDHNQRIDLSERKLFRADGTELPIIKSVTEIEGGGRRFLIESFIDITRQKDVESELRRSESRYRQFFEEDITGDFLLSMEGHLLDCNPAYLKLFGYDSPDEIKTDAFNKVFPVKPLRRSLISRLRRERRLESVELALTHRSGRPIYCIGNLIGQFDDQGRLQQIRGYLFDDTRRFMLEKDLRRAQKMEAIGTLAGGIAHDFNNILAGIMGYTEIAMAELPEDSQAAGRLELVMRSASRARDLVHQILTFSRQSDDETHPLPLRPIINEAIKLMRASLPTTIAIRDNLQTSAKVVANPVQIHQLVMNLCANAGHAMKQDGGRLTVGIREMALDEAFVASHPGLRPGDFVCIRVEDTGRGIPATIIDRIFDPFFTTKEKNEGTGLGLSVVHGIVSKLKGAITVTSTPDEGTCFHIYLPVAAEKEPSREIDENRPHPSGSESIVFVDDEPVLVEIATHILGSLGYTVTGYTDSQEALEAIFSKPEAVDLLITDMTMPGLTGLALIRRIRKRLPDLPIILCTGYSEDVSEDTAQSMGIDGYVMKPMVVKDLAEKIREVLEPIRPESQTGIAKSAG